MSVAAFPGGIHEIKQTIEWKDLAHAAYRRLGKDEPSKESLDNPEGELRDEITFSVLRALHARQAENLISAKWPLPSGNDEVCLLEDQHFRSSYGMSIGRIAHSHHWDIERLSRELRPTVGAAAELPGLWVLNEIKIACILRCADAAHIDHRRAPAMLYALTRPSGVSNIHWNFQTKLNKPVCQSGLIRYSSGQNFEIHEAPAWWLCFDTIKMIDAELSAANALLQDIGVSSLAAARVYGAESPTMLAREVRPSGWRPINAEIKASDPVNLARTLGGQQLYGRGAFAPIRELVQNAIDAIRARRRLENRGGTWGQLRIILEEIKDSSGISTWLHVDDTGIGMSERVLVGPLLDFGRSLWNSPLLQEEFPGLESRGISPIGKYGIGFFSVFLLGQNVKVITKPIFASSVETKVLEFSSLEGRPILRDAIVGELPMDISTRVSVRLESPDEEYRADPYLTRFGRAHHRSKDIENIHDVIRKHIVKLISTVDITIHLEDKIEKTKIKHNPNWQKTSAKKFLSEILSEYTPFEKKAIIDTHKDLLDNIVDEDGRNFGRAALLISKSDTRPSIGQVLVSVGGLVVASAGSEDWPSNFGYLGVVSGDTANIARNIAQPEVPEKAISEWASRQAKLIAKKNYQVSDLMSACHTIICLKGSSDDLPFCFRCGRFIDYSSFIDAINELNEICVPIEKQYKDDFSIMSISDLNTPFFVNELNQNVFVFDLKGQREIFGEELGREIISSDSLEVDLSDMNISGKESGFNMAIDALKDVWAGDVNIVIEQHQLYKEKLLTKPRENWVARIYRQVKKTDKRQ